ncbi:ribosome recycling factor [candidate division KSB1 bacterium]|nr:ribosome recycling factor [candidate division KSB1 bacterium]
MIDETIKETRRRMETTIENVRNEFGKLRTGKASPALLDGIVVDYYGSKMPIRQVANVSAPEPRLLVIQPWEKPMLTEIEKAILKSDLGLNPSNDNIVIRIPIPQLTQERREDLVKVAKKIAEENKVAIRNVRRDANDKLKKAEKDHDISEDELHRSMDTIQEITDQYTNKVEELLIKKEEDIMEI